MATPFDHYPYTNFHELNLAYFIVHFREIFAQWDQLYTDMLSWKDATDEELDEWKTGVLSDINAWETALNNALETWKSDTETDITGWMNDVIEALVAWKAAFQTLFDNTFSNLSDIKDDAEDARDDAITAQTAAEAAAAEALASATSIADSAAQIQLNSDLLVEITGNEIIDTGWSERGQYIDLSGSTADITNPGTSQNPIKWIAVSCNSGDIFTISAYGNATTARAYGFIDSSGNILAVSPSGTTTSRVISNVVTAPANSAYLIINNQVAEYHSFKRVLVSISIDDLIKFRDSIGLKNPVPAPVVSTFSGNMLNPETGIRGSNSHYFSTAAFEASSYIGVHFYYTGLEYSVFFYDNTGSVTTGSGYLGNSGYRQGYIPIPVNAKKIAICWHTLDNSTLTSDQRTVCTSNTKYLSETDTSLTLSGIPADAKTVGDMISDKPLSGVKVVNFGDSIFGKFRDDPTDPDDESISHMLGTLTGATCYNVAIAGTHSGDSQNAQLEPLPTNTQYFDFTYLVDAVISQDFTNQYSGHKHDEQINLLASIDFSKVDIVTVAYGTNDWTTGMLPNSTFYNNLKSGISDLMTAFPNLVVLICTPIVRKRDGVLTDDESTAIGGRMLTTYVNACINLSDEIHSGILDNYHHLGVNLDNWSTFYEDSTHPNIKGRRIIAHRVANALYELCHSRC